MLTVASFYSASQEQQKYEINADLFKSRLIKSPPREIAKPLTSKSADNLQDNFSGVRPIHQKQEKSLCFTLGSRLQLIIIFRYPCSFDLAQKLYNQAMTNMEQNIKSLKYIQSMGIINRKNIDPGLFLAEGWAIYIIIQLWTQKRSNFLIVLMIAISIVIVLKSKHLNIQLLQAFDGGRKLLFGQLDCTYCQFECLVLRRRPPIYFTSLALLDLSLLYTLLRQISQDTDIRGFIHLYLFHFNWLLFIFPFIPLPELAFRNSTKGHFMIQIPVLQSQVFIPFFIFVGLVLWLCFSNMARWQFISVLLIGARLKLLPSCP